MNSDIRRVHHIIFLASVFCFWLATYSYVPIFSLYLESIPFSYGSIGIILGSYGVTQVLLRFPLGVLLDKLATLRKHFYVGGFVVAIVSGFILLFSSSFLWILTGRLLAGVTAAMWVMATIMYAEYFQSNHTSKAMGLLQFSTVMPQFLSMLTAGLLVEWMGFALPFWAGIVAASVGLLLALSIKVVPSHMETRQPLSTVSIIRSTVTMRSLLPITLVSLFAHALLFISIFGFTPVYAGSQGIGEGAMVWIMTAFFVPHAAASIFIALINLPPTLEQLLMISSLMVTTITFLFLPLATGILSISLLHAIIGLTIGILLPLLLSQIASLPPASLKTSVMGFYQSVYAIGIFIGPYLAGFAAEQFGLKHVFTLAAIISFIALAIAVLTRLREGQRQMTDDASKNKKLNHL
ncbi:MFS transporter [Shouchella lehensis]|uniref:MFS transporter n=1 Tax=Shouchella lehensis TaxID=300825 RepID=A0A4Y7WFQ5_9BACI|nr:MFS transporter [Shouchella lehensis]MBG9785245.1 MFS transporter [Shouchella lehensis]TES46691.1 MFS transporter [Shouchella lehensis]